MYSLFNILLTYKQCYNFCLPARVFTVHCLISIELPTVCSSREDGCSMNTAHSSPGRVLGNPAPRDRIGQCYPVGKDARLIHPYRMEQIDSVKINPSLVMMRECLWCVWKISLRLTGWIFSLPIRSHLTRKGDKKLCPWSALGTWIFSLLQAKCIARVALRSCCCDLERVLWQCGVGWVKISKNCLLDHVY